MISNFQIDCKRLNFPEIQAVLWVSREGNQKYWREKEKRATVVNFICIRQEGKVQRKCCPLITQGKMENQYENGIKEAKDLQIVFLPGLLQRRSVALRHLEVVPLRGEETSWDWGLILISLCHQQISHCWEAVNITLPHFSCLQEEGANWAPCFQHLY